MQAWKYVDDFGKKQDIICFLHAKTGLAHPVLVIIIFLTTIGLLLHALLNGVILLIVGILMPAYESFKAIESVDPNDDTKYLYYWVNIGFLLVIDRYFGWILNMMSYAGVFRFIVLVTFIANDYYVSKMVYDTTIRPFFEKYHKKIEEATQNVTKNAMEATQEATRLGKQFATEKISEEINKSERTEKKD